MSNTASTVVPLQRHESWTNGGGVVSHLDDSEITRLEERAAVTVADPSTLGLWGFATGTWMTGTIIAGVFPATAFTAVIPVLLVFAGITQFIAGLFAFNIWFLGTHSRSQPGWEMPVWWLLFFLQGFVIMAFGTVVTGLALRRDPESGITAPWGKAPQLLVWPVLIVVASTELDFLQRWFGTTSLDGGQWLVCIGLSLVVLAIVEGHKALLRRGVAAESAPTVVEAVSPERAR